MKRIHLNYRSVRYPVVVPVRKMTAWKTSEHVSRIKAGPPTYCKKCLITFSTSDITEINIRKKPKKGKFIHLGHLSSSLCRMCRTRWERYESRWRGV